MCLDESIDTIELSWNVSLNDCVFMYLFELVHEYLRETKSYDDQIFSANSWSGGILNILYHNYEEYKSKIILNHYDYDRQFRSTSPIYNVFPHNELNYICKEAVKKIKSLKDKIQTKKIEKIF